MSESTIDLKAIWNESGVEAVLTKLDAELIGLAPVKKRIREIASLLVVDKVRREMQLAAEAKNCTILVLRRSRLAGRGEKHRAPSAAMTRWLVTPLPGWPIGNRPGLGQPCWRLHLWRQRNGPPGCWDVTLRDQSWHPLPAARLPEEAGNPTTMAANDDSFSSIASPGSAAGR